MLKNFPIMLALCFMLSSPYYAEYYAGIIDSSLLPGHGISLATYNFDCGFGYFESVLCTFQTSIQLTVVTSERLFSDFLKAVLAEVGIK